MTLLYCLFLYAAGLSIGLARNGHRSRLLSPGEAPPLSPTRVLIVGATACSRPSSTPGL